MWETETTTQWLKDIKYYEKKHSNELAAVLRNLKRFLALLETAPNCKAVQAGFLHNEPKGIVAIDQKGGGGNLQETRLYTYPHEIKSKKVLYLITIGNKNEQTTDIQLSKNFVESILPTPQTTEKPT